MEKTIKRMKLLFYICLAMFLLNSCTEEKEFIENNSKNKYSIKEYNWKEANRILKFKDAHSKVMKSIKTNSNKTNSRELFGFEVDESVVKEISNGNYSSYNMLIVKELQSEEFFENLVIEIKGDTTNAYLVKYIPSNTEATDEHGHGDFEGTIEASKVYGQTCIVCPSQGLDENGDSTGPNQGGGGPPTICITLYKCYTPDAAFPSLSIPHLSYSGACQQMPFQVCGAYGFGSTSLTGLGNGPGNPNAGPNGGLGSGGNNTTITPNLITVPIIGTITIEEKTPCNVLKKKSNDPIYKSKFLNLNNTTHFDLPYETGFNEIKTAGVTSYPNATPLPGGTSMNVHVDAINFTHVHNNKPKTDEEGNSYDGAVKMLSPGDLKVLYGLCTDNAVLAGGSPLDSFATMISDEGIFSINIIDPNFSNSDEADFNEKFKKFERNYLDKANKIILNFNLNISQRKEKMQKMLLGLINDYGFQNSIGLYEAEVISIGTTQSIKWEKKSLDNSGNLIPTPCP